MYICICNAVRECEFRRAARVADGDAEAIYAALGKAPQCRQCIDDAEELAFQERSLCRRPQLAA
ncbi:(2Fe-2S)-binding protein [Tsuneonella sp. HG222]